MTEKHNQNKAKKQSLADRLNELRGPMSVNGFARKCELSESVMRQYLGGASPNSDRLTRIAIANDVSVEWLATGEGPKQRDAFSRIGLARDAVVKFMARRSTVSEARASELMSEAFQGQLDVDGLERLHGREYPVGAAQPKQAYLSLNLKGLQTAIEAVESRMPLITPAAKASAASALYEHATATGKWELEELQAFLDLFAGARHEGTYKLPEPAGDEERVRRPKSEDQGKA